MIKMYLSDVAHGYARCDCNSSTFGTKTTCDKSTHFVLFALHYF